jgi:hypothetical protein
MYQRLLRKKSQRNSRERLRPFRNHLVVLTRDYESKPWFLTSSTCRCHATIYANASAPPSRATGLCVLQSLSDLTVWKRVSHRSHDTLAKRYTVKLGYRENTTLWLGRCMHIAIDTRAANGATARFCASDVPTTATKRCVLFAASAKHRKGNTFCSRTSTNKGVLAGYCAGTTRSQSRVSLHSLVLHRWLVDAVLAARMLRCLLRASMQLATSAVVLFIRN